VPSYLNIKEAAEYLGISSHTLYKLVERNEVPAAKVGGSWRLNREALDDFLRGSASAPTLDVLIVEPDSSMRRDLARTANEKRARLQLASSDDDASMLLDGAYSPDLVLYSVSGSAESARAFLERVRKSSESCRVALMIEPGRAAEIGMLMHMGPLIVLPKPVRRLDLVNVLSLVSE
jgi:excisionase family DNA binding protein